MTCRSSLFLLRTFVSFLVAAGVVIAPAAAQQNGGDKAVLVELKRFLQQHNPINRGGYAQWNDSEPSPCRWSGVTCDAAGQVTAVDISSSSISGPAFSNFSLLPSLAALDISGNTIEGALPDDIGRCRRLQRLNVSHNLLSGKLDIAGLTRLQSLDVSFNRFAGDITANFPAVCGNLTVLNMSTNGFTGDVTGLFDACPRLTHLDISSNKFTGAMSPGIAELEELSVAENQLTGDIPGSTFPTSCRLTSLDLSGNAFSGGFPDSVANCSSLRFLSLWGNKFTGPVPASIGMLTALRQLLLGSNRFDREIPESLRNCTELRFLDLSRNGFGGGVQAIIGELPSLVYLVLHSNNYTSGIAESGMLGLPKLVRLDLSYNSFSGTLPLAIAEMKAVRYLVLAFNGFSGAIPPEFGRLAGLQALDLSYNNISGTIPPAIGNLTSLLWLMLAGNQLTGTIPPEIGNCSSLLWINLAGNKLTGSIPPQLGSAGRNPAPTFASNSDLLGGGVFFSGTGECLTLRRWIPANYPPFTFIYSVMTRRSCQIVWQLLLSGEGIVPICANSSSKSPVRTLAITGFVQLSGNSLTGEIPAEISNMRDLSLLHLDGNRLSGELPSSISRMPLVVLNVSDNILSGPIPAALGGVRCLALLDLSRNNFSGEFPASLAQLTDLSKFNVSYNPLLSGDVPAVGQLPTFGPDSYLGDPLLRLFPSSPPAAPAGPVVREALSPKVIGCWAFVAVTATFVVISAASFVLGVRGRCRVDPGHDLEDQLSSSDGAGSSPCKSVDIAAGESPPSAWASSPPSDHRVKVFQLDKTTAFTYRDIVAATGNFADDRVIGRGGFGVVYRGELQDGRRVAVKKLVRLRDGTGEDDGEREFRAEMEVLADHPRHPNLVALYGWCLHDTAKILVYEYLDGGSLDDVITDWSRLDGEKRLAVAAAVARALAFLHHECHPAIVHRDVKASNVLLDAGRVAKVTDFGLARTVNPGDSHVSTVVAGTVGYVAPEYGQTWRATTKGDVYSYGVLLMELAVGRRAVDGSREECLLEWVRRTEKSGWSGPAMEEESSAWGKAPAAVLERVLRLALRCTAELPQERPDMPAVVAELGEMMA